MSSTPTITVIIPAYNAAKYIALALDSIYAQTLKPNEVIVVDDGSSDNTMEIVSAYQQTISLIQQTHKGAAAARNAGVAASSCEFIAFLDADDLWVEQRLELQMHAFSNNTDLDICFGKFENFFSDELSDSERAGLALPKGQISGASPVSMLARREVFCAIAPFDEQLKVGEFIDWLSRLRDTGCKEIELPQTLFFRRIHQNNTSRNSDSKHLDYLSVVKAALARKKQASKGPGDK